MRTVVGAIGVVSCLTLGVAGISAQIPEAAVLYDDDLLPTEFHRGRRDAVREALPRDAVALFFSAPHRNRQGDVFFEYRQDSDLLYLTGSNEIGTALLLAPSGVTVDGARVTEVLFVPPRDASQEVWTGRILGSERAERTLGVGKAVSLGRFNEIVGPLLEGARPLYHLPLPAGV